MKPWQDWQCVEGEKSKKKRWGPLVGGCGVKSRSGDINGESAGTKAGRGPAERQRQNAVGQKECRGGEGAVREKA